MQTGTNNKITLKGNLANEESDLTLIGRISQNKPTMKASIIPSMRGYSAYEVAVIEGFQGTVEEWLESLVGPVGPAGTTDYFELANKPSINNVTLTGDMTASDLGLAEPSDIPDITGKADKVDGATSGNFAGLDANGNLIDSGSKASDFLTQHQDISGKLDKPDVEGTQGQVLTSDGQGGQTWETPIPPVTDVQVDGTSVVENGVADIPMASDQSDGLVSSTDYNKITGAMPKTGGTFTGTVTLNADPVNNLEAATKHYVDTSIETSMAASDAMVFKGTLGTGGTVTAVPTTGVVEGDTYKVITAGTWAGSVCKVGDLLIALNSGDIAATTVNWAYVPSGNENVDDVQINGTSIVNNGVANIPIASGSTYGVARVSGAMGVEIMNGFLTMSSADSSYIQGGAHQRKAITPYYQHESTFYGLAKAAGDSTQSQSDNAVGTYTDTAKTAIQNMIGAADADEVDDFVDNLIVISDEEPVSDKNKIWIDSDSTSVQVPTYTEFTSLSGNVQDKIDKPVTAGTNGQVLTSNGNGGQTWETLDIPVETGSGVGSIQTKSFISGNATIIQTASGLGSFAEGANTMATNSASHAEGVDTVASGAISHAEGNSTTASGVVSHAEGNSTTASGFYSHAEGYNAKALGMAQHVQGKNNVEDNNNVYADIIGNGTTSNARSNAFALTWTGDGKYAGDVYVGCNDDSSGGSKLAKVSEIPNVPVQDVQVNGTSVLSNGVANVPIASSDNYGAVKILPNNSGGLQVDQGYILIRPADVSDIKAGTNSTLKPIVPGQQDRSTFYGLAKAAGDTTQAQSSNAVGTYTSQAKTAIKTMLGVVDIPQYPKVYIGTDEPSDEDVYVWIDSDGTSDGVSIIGAVLNNDYTLTISFSDGTSYTTGSIRGATGPGVASGGTQGQVLKKNSGTDYDVTWGNESVSDVQINGTSVLSGGVANIPRASLEQDGVIRVGAYGLKWGSQGLSNYVVIDKASDSSIKESSTSNYGLYYPIVPANQHKSVFYGLAKAAGDSTQSASSNAVGIYTSQAKTAIQTMLGVGSVLIEIPQEYNVTHSVKTLPTAGSSYATDPVSYFLQTSDMSLYHAVQSGSDYIWSFDIALVSIPSTEKDYYVELNGDLEHFKYDGTDFIRVEGSVSDVKINGNRIVTDGVANIPIASASKFGVSMVKIGDHGLQVASNGILQTYKAFGSDMKNGTSQYRPIVPYNQHESTFYGLAKAAGDSTQSQSSNAVGTYTNDAKTAIKTMLGVVDPTVSDVQINGTSIVSNGTANIPLGTASTPGVLSTPLAGGLFAENGGIYINGATSAHAKAGTQGFYPITPLRQHESTFYGLAKAAGDNTQSASSNAVGTYTTQAKTAIQNMLGITQLSNLVTYSTIVGDGTTTSFTITHNLNTQKFIAQCYLYNSTSQEWENAVGYFYIVDDNNVRLTMSSAPATDSLKIIIISTNMFGAAQLNTVASLAHQTFNVQVTGATPTIVAESNVRYICGEVTSLNFTPCANGVCDVVFTSGSTVTVLTLPNTVKMPEWFDAQHLETNYTYQISIADGVYGAVMSWPL